MQRYKPLKDLPRCVYKTQVHNGGTSLAKQGLFNSLLTSRELTLTQQNETKANLHLFILKDFDKTNAIGLPEESKQEDQLILQQTFKLHQTKPLVTILFASLYRMHLINLEDVFNGKGGGGPQIIIC